MNARIFRYVVRYDAGAAPRPFGGICSLAVCKPKIRATAKVGDWIIGFRSRAAGEVVYVMQVAECLPLGTYWRDARFRDRRPGASPVPDNFYRPLANGYLQQVANEVHGLDGAPRDVSGRNALVGSRFWYFGAQSPAISTDLVHLVHTSQGHSVNKNRLPDDVKNLERWLAAWPRGRRGDPIDASAALSQFLARPGKNEGVSAKRSMSTGCGALPRRKAGKVSRARTC